MTETEVKARRKRLAQTAVENMDEADDGVSIDLYALVIRLVEKWYIMFATALVGAIIAGVVTFCFITPTYQATSKLYVVSQKDSAINLSDLQIGNYLAKDYQEVFKNWYVHEAVVTRLGLPYSYDQLRKMVKVSNPSDTRILYITATSTNPAEAQAMANTYAEVAQSFIASRMDSKEPTMFETALLPTRPAAPNKTQNILLGFVLGFALAAGIIVIAFVMDDYVRTSDDIERYLGLPTLGTIMLQEDGDEELGATVRNRKHHSAKGGKGK